MSDKLRFLKQKHNKHVIGTTLILSYWYIKTQVIMLKYCLKCKKITENVNPKVIETNNDKRMLP